VFTFHYKHERQAARVIMGNAANLQQYSFNPWSLFDYSHKLPHPGPLVGSFLKPMQKFFLLFLFGVFYIIFKNVVSVR
jgi:hypothetical protein